VNLPVLTSSTQPWYANGLEFTCTQCGNCCTGAPGYVWISDEEITRLANHLQLSRDDVIEKFCRRIGNRLSLKEVRSSQGLYDCIFLKEQRITARGKPPTVKRVCSIYDVRPLQCRTWPFWDGNLASKENWHAAAKRCHGMNRGPRTFSASQIEALRDAPDWPKNPPSSK
jgi:uncharacterized protein